MVLRKSFYIHWSAERSPRVHEVNPGRDPSLRNLNLCVTQRASWKSEQDNSPVMGISY